jgi:hypothetical protein
MAINWQAVGAVATIVAAGMATWVAVVANELTTNSNGIARGANQLAAVSESDLKEMKLTETASHIYIGELPPNTAFSQRNATADVPILAIINASYIEASGVWVQGHLRENARKVYLVFGTIPACTSYTIQNDFIPETLHFTDVVGRWTRGRGGMPVAGDSTKVPRIPNQVGHPTLWQSGVPVSLPNCTL